MGASMPAEIRKLVSSQCHFAVLQLYEFALTHQAVEKGELPHIITLIHNNFSSRTKIALLFKMIASNEACDLSAGNSPLQVQIVYFLSKSRIRI